MIKFEDFYSQFKAAQTAEEKEHLGSVLRAQGYAFINEWLRTVEEDLKEMDEDGFEQIFALLNKGEEIFPTPEKHSPLWKGLWEDLKKIYQIKRSVFERVQGAERSGEWQVVIDNPLSIEGLTTHAFLSSFKVAAYYYAKYRKGLDKREWITLQRINTVILERGEEPMAICDKGKNFRYS